MPSPHVMIIGGGVGGLALAHGLKKQGISYHVYEMDRTEAYRAQGYRVRFGAPAIDALEYLLDEKVMADFETSCAAVGMFPIPEIDAESLQVVEPKMPDGSEPKPVAAALMAKGKPHCVDRGAFREVLIKNIPTENISYDKVFERYEETSSGITAHFADGSTATSDLMIGADGSGSRVRKQFLPQIQVLDTGARCIYGRTPMSPELLSVIEANPTKRLSLVKDRSQEQIIAGGFEPITFPNREAMQSKGYKCPPDYVFWVLNSTPSRMGFKEGEREYLSSEESEERAVQVTKNWAPGVRSIIEHQQKGETMAMACTSLKDQMEPWEANEHVTVIGDAAHKFTPTGAGALTALRDAQDLCGLLVKNGYSKATIGEYEEVMRTRANGEIGLSWKTIQMTLQTTANEKHFGEVMLAIRAKRVQEATSAKS